LTLCVLLLTASSLHAGEKNVAAILRGTYTTTSKTFFNPDAAAEEQRSQYVQLDGIIGGGIELRYRFPGENVFLTLSVDDLSKVQERLQLVAFAPSRRLPVTEGVRLIPVELGLHTFIPLGSETMRLSMGGGIGAYFGERVLRVAGVDAETRNRPMHIGIHIASGFEYLLLSGVWVRGDMKFRDPELRTVSRFTQEQTQYESVLIVFPQNEFSSRINVNGMAFSLGVVVELF
jgi:hypothetical protein